MIKITEKNEKKLLDYLEYRDDMSFLGIAEFRYQKNRGCQQALGGIVKVTVLSEIA